ncbi:hypothetical protein BKA82DRAFT_16683 [Pisolithus tinctorius]|uniref:Uncharacterized protein n=1 Tax=Pisolithus tinctorius Marx 270 TaxID=870435 RepID=A0A0C3NAK0_PISTI|nr:hypothetical protein BKA82DRAFT_16683 [Pisolithus tinctorius]KIN98124.1 hypothetical protein M404DRAFT_16683 [Pisolithus tinctorius Marx 270]
MTDNTRNRQSISDIEQELYDIFKNIHSVRFNQSSEPTISADVLPDVIRQFSELYGVELLSDEEMQMLRALLASNPGIEVTPQVLLQFIAERTRHSPRGSPGKEGQTNTTALPTRTVKIGRQSSDGTSRIPSRPPSVPPKTPINAPPPSAFDTSRRQRTTPLAGAAPSSWTRRPLPAGRRRSLDGTPSSASSDTEASSPTSLGSTSVRVRAPSNPTSPRSDLSSPSYPSQHFLPRPHSRAQSQPLNAIGFHYISPDRDHDRGRNPLSPNPLSPDLSFESSFDYPRQGNGTDSFLDGVSSLPLPRLPSSDGGSDSEDESSLGLVLDRSATSSAVSLEPLERLDALQKANTELGRKLMEAERTLQVKLNEHDTDLEEMQARLEELKSELTATKREEKELRAKERVNSTQMAALESEIAKLQKSLENARSAYQSLQKQYQEQCAESERYRNTLRRRDQELKDLQDLSSLQTLEAQKWAREHDTYESRIAALEAELELAQQAHAQLEEQKQENLMLKETIDRMRFEMDEMRSLHGGSGAGAGGGSQGGSQQGSVSKSLGAELLGKIGTQWGMDEDDESGDEGAEEGGDTEGEEEDVIERIITRKKRKVAGRSNKVETVIETKEYTDASTQYFTAEHTSSCGVETDPPIPILTSVCAIQTDGARLLSSSIQTEAEPVPIPKITTSIEVQTDIPVEAVHPVEPSSPERVPSPLEDEEEAMTSSSSTLLPPTPKSSLLASPHLQPHDLPPSYNQVASQSSSSATLTDPRELLKTWHKGLELPISPLPGGISEDAVEEWRALKEDLGVECSVIDKIIEASTKTGGGSRSRNRFYNIYNTYVYGANGSKVTGPSPPSSGGDSSPLSFLGTAKHFLLYLSASALVYLIMGPYVAPQYGPIGGATYYDRAAWSSFNSMQAPGEGFGYDGTRGVWSVVERVGVGAARIAGGWPT